MKRFLNLILLMFLLAACSQNNSSFANSGVSPDHQLWNELLHKYVSSNGFMNYKGISTEKEKLQKYLDELSENAPSDTWNKEEKLAYWINAYNAFTVKLIVDNYPVESIKDLNPTISIPTLNTVWTKEWFKIGGEDFSLDRIEHKILRKQFNEPRIHFAINCASFSCPVLRNEAYTADKIERQLNEQAKAFINDTQRNKINKNEVELSKIFNWFGGDFKKGQTLIDFLNKYSKIKIDKDAEINFMDYDWSLNDASQ